MLVYIKWKASLEPVYCHETDSVAELRRRMMSAAPAPIEHKLLVHKGLLLRDGMILTDAGIEDDCTIHLVLNENPFEGKKMLVKTAASAGGAGGSIRTIYVTENFKIQDIKEDIYAFPGEAAPESQVLIFVGKQLENDRTIREYNIQKGSCLRVINAGYARNDIKSFVRSTYPAANALNVPLNTSIVVQVRAAHTHTHFRTHAHARMQHTRMNARSHARTHAPNHAPTHVRARARTHPRTHAPTHAPRPPLNPVTVSQLTSIDEDESQYWGNLLGSPDLETILPQQLQLREKATYMVVRYVCKKKKVSLTRIDAENN